MHLFFTYLPSGEKNSDVSKWSSQDGTVVLIRGLSTLMLLLHHLQETHPEQCQDTHHHPLQEAAADFPVVVVSPEAAEAAVADPAGKIR